MVAVGPHEKDGLQYKEIHFQLKWAEYTMHFIGIQKNGQIVLDPWLVKFLVACLFSLVCFFSK